MTDSSDKYYGKYRGTVVNNIDPLKMGRLQVLVPDVGIALSTWAMPCVPIGGIQTGMYFIPPLTAGVWIEFEHGDPDYPVWVGYWWGSAVEVPATALLTTPGAPVMIIETPLTKSAIVLSDVPQPTVPPMVSGILLRSGPSSITIDSTGVKITAPLITLIGAVNITGATNINAGALLVT